MLDVDPAKITRIGRITMEGGEIRIEGFEGEGCSCRDLAALVCCWAIGELQRELNETLMAPGGGKASVD